MGLTERKRASKVVDLHTAASMVQDAMILGLGGVHSHEAPAAFSRELIRRGVKNLTIVPNNASGYQTDILIGAGCVKTIYNSYCGLDYVGDAPNFRRFAESGRLNVFEFDEMGLLRGLKAAAAGVAFFPLPHGFLGVDVWKANPEFYQVIEDPFTKQKVVVCRPITPDIAVIHCAKCDEYGNGRELQVMEDILYQAAKKVILTTEEIVSLEDTQMHYKEVTILGKFIDAVVEVPYGCHPGQCSGKYIHDSEHLREYQIAARNDDSLKEYLDKYVYGAPTHERYLELIGHDRLLKLEPY